MNFDKGLNFFFNEESNNTPNRNKKTPGIGQETPSNYNNESIFHSYLNESNGVPILNDITDEGILETKFDNQENEIKRYCSYYLTLKNIFKDSDLATKNKLLQYVANFNNRCKNFVNYQTNLRAEAKKNSEVKNKLKEDLDQKNKDFEKIKKRIQNEFEEIKVNMQKQIDDNKFKLNRAEEEIKKLRNNINKLNQDIIKKDKEIFSLRENYINNNQSSSQDYFTISYCLGDQTENLDTIGIYCPKKSDLDSIKEKWTRAENNFNRFAHILVDINNKALEKYKEIYFKKKGEQWMESKSKNTLIKMYNPQTYNINQDISWTNIMDINITINAIINEICDLVTSTIDCDPIILNKDSCDFLLDYIIGIKRTFFLQKFIQENTLNLANYENCEQILAEFKKEKEISVKFFEENSNVLTNQTYNERFKNVLKDDKTEILPLDNYFNIFNSMFKQATNFYDKEDNELEEYKKFLNSQNNRNTIDDIDMDISSSKNKTNNNNGI